MGAAPRSSAGFQTHLNFRRENQSTKGKTWDRTAFAESGRRLVVKAKDKAKGYVPRDWVGEDEDDEEEEEEEDFEPLVPGPKPFVDPRKSPL
jgi:ATP-dependent DNA helicase MPH1